MKPSTVLISVLAAAVLVFAAAACGGSSSKHASGSTIGTTGATTSKTYDIQTVEGCFLSGGNIHDTSDQGWFDIVNLGAKAQGAFSTFPGSSFDNAAYYFFSSHDQAEQMLQQADKKAHDPAKVYVVGNVIAVDYEDLHAADQKLQARCLS